MRSGGKAQANFFLWPPLTPKQRIAEKAKCDSSPPHALFFLKKSGATVVAPGKLARFRSSLFQQLATAHLWA